MSYKKKNLKHEQTATCFISKNYCELMSENTEIKLISADFSSSEKHFSDDNPVKSLHSGIEM